MRFNAVIAAIACVLIAGAARAEDENPFKSAKVGDWVEYTTAMKGDAFNFDGAMKQTIKAKTDEEVTLEISMKTPTGDIKQDTKIKLNQKFDPRRPLGD